MLPLAASERDPSLPDPKFLKSSLKMTQNGHPKFLEQNSKNTKNSSKVCFNIFCEFFVKNFWGWAILGDLL